MSQPPTRQAGPPPLDVAGRSPGSGPADGAGREATAAARIPGAGGGNPHGRGSAADLVRSLGVVVVLALALVALVPRPEGGSDRFEDYAAAATAAAAAASYDVLVPRPLPAGWSVVRTGSQAEAASGQTNPGLVWRLDAQTAAGRYVSLEQSGGTPGPLARRATDQARPAGVTRAGGWQWTRHAGRQQRFLVHKGPGSTTVVVGDASWADLQAFAATLHPVR